MKTPENKHLTHPGDIIAKWQDARLNGKMCSDCPGEIKLGCMNSPSSYHDKCFMAWTLLHPGDAFIGERKTRSYKDYGIASSENVIVDSYVISSKLKCIFIEHRIRTVGDLLAVKSIKDFQGWNGVGVKLYEEIKILVEKIKTIRETYDKLNSDTE